MGAGDGFRVDTSVVSELVSTTKVVLRLDAKVAVKCVLFSMLATDAAYAVPVVFVISATTEKSVVHLYVVVSSLNRRGSSLRLSDSCLRLLSRRLYVKTHPRISSSSTPSSDVNAPFNLVLS